MAQEFWINFSHVNLYPYRAKFSQIPQVWYEWPFSPSESPFLSPLLPPFETFPYFEFSWIRLSRTLMGPLQSLRGCLALTINTQTITPTCCNLTLPLFSDRVDGWESRSIVWAHYCYELLWLPQRPSKTKQLWWLLDDFDWRLISPHIATLPNVFEFENASENSTRVSPTISYILIWL